MPAKSFTLDDRQKSFLSVTNTYLFYDKYALDDGHWNNKKAQTKKYFIGKANLPIW